MTPKSIIVILSIIVIIAGIYSIYASIKNTHQNHSQRKFKHRMIQKILGINGARVFYGFLGAGLIVFGLFMLFQFFVKPNLGNEYNNKTDKFVLISNTISNDKFIMTSSLTTTLEQLKSSIKIVGNAKLDEYVQIDFNNNYLDNLPDIVWQMKNLKTINLTNNNISDLDIDKISKMDSLKTIDLTNNPISIEKINEIRANTTVDIKN